MSVILVVPDAGPLISLGKAGRLEILLTLRLPICVVDQVRFEVTNDNRFADARRIDDFIRNHPDVVQEFVTAVGAAAAVRRAAGETRQPVQGEAAIAELLQRIDEVTGDPDAPVLLLYEDSDVRKSRFILPPNVHVLSTWGLLLGLERKGLVRSAHDIWREIEAAGRSPSQTNADVPGTTPRGPTSW
nr:hypothetical protein [uncultured Rhodopila sp.]